MARTPDNAAAATLLERVDTRLAELGKSRYWLSKEATGGKNTAVFTEVARKGFIPKEERLRSIAHALGVSVDWLMGRTASREPARSEVGLLQDPRPRFNGFELPLPRIPVMGTGDCADLQVCDETGQLIDVEQSSFDPDYHVDYVERPHSLAGDRNAYAIEFRGGSMEPRFFAGERALVSPGRHAGVGDDVVVQLNDGESSDVTSVLVKRLLGQNSSDVILQQYNPPITFKVPRARVVRIHRIVEVLLR